MHAADVSVRLSVRACPGGGVFPVQLWSDDTSLRVIGRTGAGGATQRVDAAVVDSQSRQGKSDARGGGVSRGHRDADASWLGDSPDATTTSPHKETRARWRRTPMAGGRAHVVYSRGRPPLDPLRISAPLFAPRPAGLPIRSQCRPAVPCP